MLSKRTNHPVRAPSYKYEEPPVLSNVSTSAMAYLEGYNPNSPLLSFKFAGSIFVLVLGSLEFWFFFGYWLVLYILRVTSIVNLHFEEKRAALDNLDNVYDLLYFFLVFYLNTNYNRWWEQTSLSLTAWGRLSEICALSRAYIRSRRIRSRFCRLANAMHHIFYQDLSTGADFDHLERLKLLTEPELKFLRDKYVRKRAGYYVDYMIGWMLEDLDRLQEEKVLTESQSRVMGEVLFQFRRQLMSITLYSYVPIPLAYYQLAQVFSVLLLLSGGFVAAMYVGGLDLHPPNTIDRTDTGVFSYILTVFVIIGMKRLALRFAFPYHGHDECLNVYYYTMQTLEACGCSIDYSVEGDPYHDTIVDKTCVVEEEEVAWFSSDQLQYVAQELDAFRKRHVTSHNPKVYVLPPSKVGRTLWGKMMMVGDVAGGIGGAKLQRGASEGQSGSLTRTESDGHEMLPVSTVRMGNS